MFADQRQIHRALTALLAGTAVHAGPFWTFAGPTHEAMRWVLSESQRTAPMSDGELLVLRIAFDFWNGSGKAPIGEIIRLLDLSYQEAIAELLTASIHGPRAVDAWILKYEARGGVR